MNDIVLSHVTKRFTDKTVLHDFSHCFPGGEITCICGASGCGKTTLLRLLASLITPDGGTITGLSQKVSFVFQDDRLCETFSALRNIRCVTGNYLTDAEINRHLIQLGLEDTIGAPVSTFSGGMKRRVAIARAMCYPSDLILLDEPFKGLDPALRYQVMDYVKQHRGGRTLLCVTHDEAEATYLGSRIFHMP